MIEPALSVKDISFLIRAFLYRSRIVPLGLQKQPGGRFKSRGHNITTIGTVAALNAGRAGIVAMMN